MYCYRGESCVRQLIHLSLGKSSLQAELDWKLCCRSFPEDARDVQPEERVRIQLNEVVVQLIFSTDQ